jgi:hypothetical protein
VQAATTSWIVYGVTITMKPNEIAAIVLDVEPRKTLSCSTICGEDKKAMGRGILDRDDKHHRRCQLLPLKTFPFAE